MKPIKFEQHNCIFAEDQQEYLPLPAHIVDEIEKRVITCWKFSFKEKLRVLFGAPMWFSQMTFGAPLQPQLPTLDTPFIKD